MNDFTRIRVTALAGGVGGARLAHGLAQVLPPENLSVVVNTGDDFEHLGLKICPDMDTVMYTLAGVANPQTGWGLAGESFYCLETLKQLGGPDWFHLGDRDLATHLYRTAGLHAGQSLTTVTAELSRRWGCQPALLPMSDDIVRTRVVTDAGEMDFQEYFVHQGWQPRLQSIRWTGDAHPQPTEVVLQALESADLIILCPSNPFVSIDPILNLPGVRSMISRKVTVAVSPIIGGQAVKGPAAKMFTELGMVPSALAVAEYYRDILCGFVFDQQDADLLEPIHNTGLTATCMPTLLVDAAARKKIAAAVLEFAVQLAR